MSRLLPDRRDLLAVCTPRGEELYKPLPLLHVVIEVVAVQADHVLRTLSSQRWTKERAAILERDEAKDKKEKM